MLDSKALANAGAAVAIVSYIICIVLIYVAPDFTFSFFSRIFHGISLATLVPGSEAINLPNSTIGALSIAGLIWVLLFSFGTVYNKLEK